MTPNSQIGTLSSSSISARLLPVVGTIRSPEPYLLLVCASAEQETERGTEEVQKLPRVEDLRIASQNLTK
eukprot:c14117_g1_i3 orf=138-347(-)